jgi:Na+-transporting NADH:ubiquinone oxidoreductase subunit NqrA
MSNVPNQVVVYEDTPNQIIVNQDPPNQIVVRLSTISGNTRRHVHTQASVSNVWVINHALVGKPSVTIVDSADTVVVGEVTYNSNSQVTVTFTQPFSGFAYLT